MTAKRHSSNISEEEFAEMNRLFLEFKSNISSYSIADLEKFTDLFTRSIAGKGDERANR